MRLPYVLTKLMKCIIGIMWSLSDSRLACRRDREGIYSMSCEWPPVRIIRTIHG